MSEIGKGVDFLPKNLKIKLAALSFGAIAVLAALFTEFLHIARTNGTSSEIFGTASLLFGALSSVIVIVFVVILVKMMLSYQKNLILLNEGLSSITDNIPGGMVCCKNNPKFEVSFVSDSFVEMTGYTKEDIDLKFDGEFFKMVFPSDRKILEAKLRDNPNESVFQYRMVKSDGTTIWIYDKGKLVGDNKKGSLYYRVLTDITELKTAEQALMKSKSELNLVNERYRMVLDQSNYVVFDLDIVSNVVTYSSNYEKNFGMAPKSKNFPASFVDDGMVHPDDIKRFLSFFEKIKDDTSDRDEEIRIRSKNGGYSWYNICVSTILGENGNIVRAIGRMADITKQRSESARILTKNQIDKNTGLMNIQTAFDYIKTLTENDNVTPSALMLIGISDNSPEIVPAFASRLRDLFRSTDILGYTDENKFIVFMKNCNKQLVERRSLEILSVIKEFSEETEIFGNIGITLSPKDSEEISEIYKKAQLALVHSENKKRSGYTIYEEI